MKWNSDKYTALILAGGNSTRMRYPKHLLKTVGNTTFLAAIIASIKEFGIKNIVVVLNEKYTTPKWKDELIEIEKEAIIIKNESPEKGRLFTIQKGLKMIESDFVFIHNVDNPIVEVEVLQKMILSINKKNDVIIPTYKGKGGHPVLINHKIKKEIIDNYERYKTLKGVLFSYKRAYVEVGCNSIHYNINTPKELQALNYANA